MPLVVLSYLVASFASFTALSMAQQLVGAKSPRERSLLHWGGAFAMGAGIWSMHFIGMLSYKMRMAVAYDPWVTLLSMVIAIAVAYGVLGIVAREKLSPRHLLIGAVLLGLGICGMHYTGMAAMRMDGKLRYIPDIFLLSVAIAIGASGAALWIAFTLARNGSKYRDLFQTGAALVMGAGICGMHYTGMAAAVFMPYAGCRYDPDQNFDRLALSIAGIASLILSIALIVSFYKREQEELRLQSEREQAATQLQLYMRQLERSNQELEDFAHIASHDLKEPLRGLSNHAFLLLRDFGDKLDEKGVYRLNRMTYLAKRMEQLVNDLLYFSQLGKAELAIQDTDLNVLVNEVRSMMETLLQERHAQIVVPRPLPHIVCDRARVNEVFRNLITNAVKYNDKPAPVVEVGFLERLETAKGVENGVLYVKDNGIGIEPEFHEEIFRIFMRLQAGADEKESGTGVGLTFVKKIIDRHQGRIWLESEPGKGTIFYFTLNRTEPGS